MIVPQFLVQIPNFDLATIRPDKPRIPFEDMDCKVTFQVIFIIKIFIITAVNIIFIIKIITVFNIITIMKISTFPSRILEFPTTLEPSQELLAMM